MKELWQAILRKGKISTVGAVKKQAIADLLGKGLKEGGLREGEHYEFNADSMDYNLG